MEGRDSGCVPPRIRPPLGGLVRWHYSAVLEQRYYSKWDMVRGMEKLARWRGESVEEVAAALDGLGLFGHQIATALKQGLNLLN